MLHGMHILKACTLLVVPTANLKPQHTTNIICSPAVAHTGQYWFQQRFLGTTCCCEPAYVHNSCMTAADVLNSLTSSHCLIHKYTAALPFMGFRIHVTQLTQCCSGLLTFSVCVCVQPNAGVP